MNISDMFDYLSKIDELNYERIGMIQNTEKTLSIWNKDNKLDEDILRAKKQLTKFVEINNRSDNFNSEIWNSFIEIYDFINQENELEKEKFENMEIEFRKKYKNMSIEEYILDNDLNEETYNKVLGIISDIFSDTNNQHTNISENLMDFTTNLMEDYKRYEDQKNKKNYHKAIFLKVKNKEISKIESKQIEEIIDSYKFAEHVATEYNNVKTYDYLRKFSIQSYKLLENPNAINLVLEYVSSDFLKIKKNFL